MLKWLNNMLDTNQQILLEQDQFIGIIDFKGPVIPVFEKLKFVQVGFFLVSPVTYVIMWVSIVSLSQMLEQKVEKWKHDYEYF